MRCKCCDKILSDLELIATDKQGNYEDMCGTCLRASGVYYDDDTYSVEYDYEGEQELIEDLVGDYNDLEEPF